MRDENEVLRRIREATPSRQIPGTAMSRSELAELVVAHVQRHTKVVPAVDRKYIARLETGRIRWPNERYRHALRDILGVESDAELGFINSYLLRGARQLDEPVVDLTSPWTPDGVYDAIIAISEVDAMDATDRRQIFRVFAGAPLALVALDAFVAPVTASVARQGDRKISHADVDAIDAVVDGLRRQDDRCGSGGVVMTLAMAQVRAVAQLLKFGTYSDSIGRRLYGAAAELLRFLGWLHWDSLQYAKSQQCWVAALKAARFAGDNQIRANVLAFMGCQCDELGRHDDAIRLGAAARLSLNDSPRVATIAHLLYSNSVAVRDERESRLALDAAHDAFARASHASQGPAFAYWVDEAHLHEHDSRSHLAFGDTATAIDGFTSSVALSRGRERVRAEAFLARAFAAHGEPEQAAQAGMRALDLLDDIVSARSIDLLQRVSHALVPFDTPEVVDFNHRLLQVA